MQKPVKLPRRLTAENGAKGLLSGEFFEKMIVQCPECDGEGFIDDGIVCEECGGAGDFSVKVPIGWSTIKDIYRKIVENLEIKDGDDDANR